MIQNPILTGFQLDPSICRVCGDYFIATPTLNNRMTISALIDDYFNLLAELERSICGWLPYPCQIGFFVLQPFKSSQARLQPD